MKKIFIYIAVSLIILVKFYYYNLSYERELIILNDKEYSMIIETINLEVIEITFEVSIHKGELENDLTELINIYHNDQLVNFNDLEIISSGSDHHKSLTLFLPNTFGKDDITIEFIEGDEIISIISKSV